MQTGIRYRIYPNTKQKRAIAQWIGCARFIWNAKCEDLKYQRSFCQKYLPVGTFPKVNSSYAQFKSKELSPWLYDCPSIVLRNSITLWRRTYSSFLKGISGAPRRKNRSKGNSVWLTREMFKFERNSYGAIELFVGGKSAKHCLGKIPVKWHRAFPGEPNSIWIKREHNQYYLSFAYEQLDDFHDFSDKATLDYLRTMDAEDLEVSVMGIDRGVARPIQSSKNYYDMDERAKNKRLAKERYIKRMQKKVSKQVKGSRRSKKTRLKIAKSHRFIKNQNNDHIHKVSREIVNDKEVKVFALEDLQLKNMTRRAKAKKDGQGKWQKNGAKAKSGLNKAMLSKGLYKFELFLGYKARKAGKLVVKVSAHYSSQECAACGHTQAENRESQSRFSCKQCGNKDNADMNAAKVIKKRAIIHINSGTELSSKGVFLSKKIEDGRVRCKTVKASVLTAVDVDPSKKTNLNDSLAVV